MSDPAYLDCNATTRPNAAVVEEMLDCLRGAWGNPSSTHGPGQAARRVLGDARARVAAFLGCAGAELVFTSGATEANHMALLGALELGLRPASTGRDGPTGRARRRLVLSAVEHSASLALAERLRSRGQPVDLIPVNRHGELDLDAAAALIRDDVALVSVMGANNETGVLMPTQELARLARAAGAPLHVDATQLAGKTTLRFDTSGADLWSVSAHKLGGPKGVGGLVVRKGLAWPALFSGRQERHRRGGTENLAGIVGFAAAAEQAGRSLARDIAHMRGLQVRLEAGLREACGDVHVHGAAVARLPNTTYLRFGTLDADQVLARLEGAGVVASSGAACSASGSQPSHVLLAMGESSVQARAGVRLSTWRETRAAEIDHVIAAAARVLAPLLEAAPQPAVLP